MDCNEDQSCLKNNVKELNEIPTVSLESKDIDLNKTLTVHLENKVKELHSNVRHITQLGTGLSYKKLKVFNAIIKLSKLSAKSSSCSFLF